MEIFEKATNQFLHVGTKEPKPLPSDVTTTTMQIMTTPRGQDPSELLVRVHCRGVGPAALLVHGWRSQAADMQPLASMLVGAGFQVWMPDLPGHGHSDGEHLSIPLAADVLQAVQTISGPFALAVGHSYGGASLVHALAGGLQVQRVAVLAAPTHYGHFARLGAQQAGMPKAMLESWLSHLAASIGCHPDEINMKRQVLNLSMPAMLAHSKDDPVTPFDQLQEVASIWPGAMWLPLEGLGHFRLLTDPYFLSELQNFACALKVSRQ
jgi:pimeloyl-ACP methyl ester carboxylesterase